MLTGRLSVVTWTLLLLWSPDVGSCSRVGLAMKSRPSSHRWIRSQGYGSGGNSCVCPYQTRDDGNDDILNLALGTILGYLLATPMMMMMNAAAGGGGAAAGGGRAVLEDTFWSIFDGKPENLDVGEMTVATLSMMDAFRRTVEKPECSRSLICRADFARKRKDDLKTTFDLLGCMIGLTFTMDAYSLAEQLLPIIFHRPRSQCSDVLLAVNSSCNFI